MAKIGEQVREYEVTEAPMLPEPVIEPQKTPERAPAPSREREREREPVKVG